ncbi:MAG TPA: NACHT domain-containing protein, partial [Anaerolineaceae bacterium]|nr:NACHT domain-containing protein [Anaerolineaceae bacterium]
MPSPSIPSNIIAFWLGFLAATVFWFIVSRLRPQIPRLRAAIRARISAMRRRVQDQIDDALRRELLKRAQAMHLGASLFALDEILVPPALLVPPSAFINPGTPAPDTMTNQVIPYLPDWPELASAYPVAKFTLAEALKNSVPVAVIGQPGIGKTVALADLASKVARRAPETGMADHTPVLVSIFDLPYQETTSNPLDGLIALLSHSTPVFAQSRLPAFITQAAKNGALLVLVDGLDELPPPMLENAILYLTRLRSQYPRIKCAITAIPQQVPKLNQAGFLSIPLATWNHTQVEDF